MKSEHWRLPKTENEDKNDCHKTTKDSWEEINAGKGTEARRNDSGLKPNKFVNTLLEVDIHPTKEIIFLVL